MILLASDTKLRSPTNKVLSANLRTMADRLLFAFLIAGALSMLFMSLRYFHGENVGVLTGKAVSKDAWYGLTLRAHIVFGLIAIIIGPFQFVVFLREWSVHVHRFLGRLYVVSVVSSGLCGLVVAPFAMGGTVARLGFSTLALVWLYSAMRAVLAIYLGDPKSHERFMFLNFGLTFAAIPQRTLLLAPLILNIEFMTVYRLSAWLPWMLSTGIAMTMYRARSSNAV